MDVNFVDMLIEENSDKIAIVRINSGEVSLINCHLNLSHLTTFTNTVIPAVYCENAIVKADNVSIIGNNEFLTVGFLSFNCIIEISECIIQDHRCGGFLSKINENNKIIISKSSFLKNSGIGVYVKGKGQMIHLEDNSIKKNLGIGIKIIDCKNINVISNNFKYNLLNGCELINCDGLIMLNSFKNNKGHGLLLESQNEGYFLAKIFNNFIENNYLSGVVVKGENNFAKIYQNKKMCKNYLNGIQVLEKATPKIFDNIIDSNLNHGILINSGSSAIVEKNVIFENQKSNIAFGGKLSENTIIEKNKIYGSKNEGIYVTQTSGGIIRKNEIHSNNDGIIVSNCSSLEITENNIYTNIRCGILISSRSEPTLTNNNIHDNDFIGLFIRDESFGEYVNNEIKKNNTQLFLSKNCRKIKNKIIKDNMIEGRIDVDGTCFIF
jgi:parallel beta-helix repeat protein